MLALTAHQTHSQVCYGVMITARLGNDDVSRVGKVPSGLLHAAVAQTDSARLPAASCGEDGDLGHRKPRPRACSHGGEHRTRAHRVPRDRDPQAPAPRNRENNIGRWALAPRRGRSRCSPTVLPVGPGPSALRGPRCCWMRTARSTRGPRWPCTAGTATRPGTQRQPPGKGGMEGGRERGGENGMGSPRTPAQHSPNTFHSSRPPCPPFPALPLRPRRAGTPSPCQAPRGCHSGGRTTTPGGESGVEGAGAFRPSPLHLSWAPGSCRRPPCLGGGHFASRGAGRSGAERRDYSSQGAPQRRHFAACAGPC